MMNSSPLANGASPNTRKELSTSTTRTPINRFRRGVGSPATLNSRMKSTLFSPSHLKSPHRRSSMDSPSRQLVREFAIWQAESQMHLKHKLDQETEALKEAHEEALEYAAAKHAEVLADAEKARETLQLQIENERLRRQQAADQELERVRKEKVALLAAEKQRLLEETLQREREAQQQRERERQAVEAQNRAKEEAQRQENEKRQREEAETARRKQEEEERRAQEEAATKAAQAAQASTSAPAVQPPTSSTQQTSTPLLPYDRIEAEHNQYLALHQKLKGMRKHVMSEFNKNKNKSSASASFKEMNNWRRQMTKVLGQTTENKERNRSLRVQVEQILQQAWNTTDVALDARDYILNPTSPFPDADSARISGVFIYLLNMLVKTTIAQMIASSTQTAYNAVDYYGIIIALIFSKAEFRLNGNSFADIVLAKYHHACPYLFGISGPDNTPAGRKRLGWAKEPDGSWVTTQTHYDKVNALSIGWAALTLRNFSKQPTRSSIPAWRYWQSLAGIVNIPRDKLGVTHALAIKGLVDQYAHLFIQFYGHAAIVVLRTAIVQIPKEAPAGAGFDTVTVLRDNIWKKYKIRL